MEVNINNIEEQILLYADGELNTEEAKALLQYIALHPEWRTLLEEYKSLVMQPDTNLVFEGKDALLQPEEGQVIAFKKANNFKKVGWAAAAVLLISAAGLTWMLSNPQEQGLVLPDAPAMAMQPKQSQPAIVSNPADTVKSVQPVSHAPNNIAPKAVTQQPVWVHTPQVKPDAQRKEDDLSPIGGNTLAAIGTEAQPLPAQEIQRPETLLQDTPEEVAIQAEALPVWLPVSSEKLEGVNDLVAHIKAVKEKVTAKANLVRKSTFVLRFGEKEIAFGK